MRELNHWDQRFLDLAAFISWWSKDPSTKVGAVIANPQNHIVSVGYNGFPRGVEDTLARLNDRELKYKMVVHAERNALIFAGRDLTGCTLYTHPFMPCGACAGMIIQAGISEVITYGSDNPRWQKDFEVVREMFEEALVTLYEINPLIHIKEAA